MHQRMSEQVGYVRVSSTDQCLDRQLDGIELNNRFEDKCSGGTTNRPGLEACLKHLRKGDTLHVHSIDRLARNLLDLQTLVTDLTNDGVAVVFHKEALTFSGDANPMQTLQLQMMGAFAQFERSLIRERQAEGFAKAKALGKKLGAPNKLSEDQRSDVKANRQKGTSVSQLAREYGVARKTIYAALNS